MPGRGHKNNARGRGSLPGRFVSLVVSSGPADHQTRTAGALRMEFRSLTVAWCHRSGSGYSRPQTQTIGSRDRWWEWLHSDRPAGSRAQIVSPCASDALTLLRFWDQMVEKGCRWGPLPRPRTKYVRSESPTGTYIIGRRVLNGTTDILDYRFKGSSYRWVSGRNYYRDSEGAIATATGYKWVTRSDADDTDEWETDDPTDRALMWLHAITYLAEWWREQRSGQFPATISQMGWQFVKSRITPKTLSSHTVESVIKLERTACHGGRATAWYSGDVRDRGRHTPPESLPYPSSRGAVIAGPIHLVDVRSMYPTLMRDRDFPAKLATMYGEIPVSQLSDLCRMYHVVARVSLDTEIPEYPYRTGVRVLYPVGRFTSTLATPELRLALSEGSIVSVHEVSCYYRGRPFERAAAELLRMREDAEKAGNVGWAKLAKSIANTVTGKLAQRKGVWVPVTDVAPHVEWGEWTPIGGNTDTPLKYRAFAGMVERYDQSDRGTGTLTAAYAVLTAYGRCQMRAYRATLPYHSVLSQDTDGIWITSAGLAELTRTTELESGLPGLLRLQRSVSSARFWNSDHYCADGKWTLAGLSSPALRHGSAAYVSAASLNPARMTPRDIPREITEIRIEGTIDITPADGVHGEDGWMVPYRMPLGSRQGIPIDHPPPPGLFDAS